MELQFQTLHGPKVQLHHQFLQHFPISIINTKDKYKYFKMPVTSRSLLINHVSGTGKKAPTNLRYNPVKKQTVNINCHCKIHSPISVRYIVAGSYTIELPLLPSGYLWQITGSVTSGGGGGGGGGGGINIFGNYTSGGGGFTNFATSTVPININATGGEIITSFVGSGGAGGAGGGNSTPGFTGGLGNSSFMSLTNGITFVSNIVPGGLGGGANTGNPIGQVGGSGPGSSGSGGTGSTNSGSPGLPGAPGADGSVIFTATPIPL
jgi:hypothetical protein